MINLAAVSGVFNPEKKAGNNTGPFLNVGITGGIGSGKSFVCRLFSCMGIPVYEADSRARWLTENHPEIRENVLNLLGPQAYHPDGSYNSTYVSSVVFGKPSLLVQLNHIIHPVVGEDSEQWMQAMQDSGRFPYALKEAAIMNRAGENNTLNYVIVVAAPVETRIQRVMQRDSHRSEADIRNIISRQMPDEERLKSADFVLYNDGLQPLLSQVITLHHQLTGY